MKNIILLIPITNIFSHKPMFSDNDLSIDIHKHNEFLPQYYFNLPAKNCKLQFQDGYYIVFNLKNSEIYAMCDGEVLLRGETVSIKSHNNSNTIFIKYKSLENIQVKTGDIVKQGAFLGISKNKEKLYCRILADDFVLNANSENLHFNKI